MRWSPVIFSIAVLVFFASALSVLAAVDYGNKGLAIAGAVGMGIAGILFLLSIFGYHRRVDWTRVRAEQRLWESGPLGRTWLRVRQRLGRLWKI